MKGQIGDRVVIVGHRVGQVERSARILEVRGQDGGPPYRVRWEDSGAESMLYPGSDARVVPEDGEARAGTAASRRKGASAARKRKKPS